MPSGYVLEGSSGNTLAPATVNSGQAVSNINAGLKLPSDHGGGPSGSSSRSVGHGGFGADFMGGGSFASSGSTGSVGGFAWADEAGTGLRTLNDAAVSNITVELLDASGDVFATTTTNSAGHYQFSNLSAGTHSVMFIIPSSYLGAAFTIEGASSDPTLSSSAYANGATDSFTLAAGQSWMDENVGLTGLPV